MSASISTPTPNYVDPPTRSPAPQVICIIFLVLVVIALALRLYTRARITRTFGLDDVLMIGGTACAVAAFIISIVATNSYGWNRHAWDVPLATLVQGRKLSFVFNVIFSLAACQTKLSLLWFSRRLIGIASGGFFRSSYVSLVVLLVIVGLCEASFIIVTFLECRPLKAAWDVFPDYSHTCVDLSHFFVSMGVINTCTDFFCTVLPALIVMRLQMPFRRRLAVASVFIIGISVNIASALRIYYLYTSRDTWDFFACTITATFEIGLGLLCVNAPALRPLFMQCVNYFKSRGLMRGAASAGGHTIAMSQSAQIKESEKLAGYAFDSLRTRQFSEIKGAPSLAPKEFEGIEITRTLELENLRQASYPTSIDDQGDVELGSQDEISLRS